MPPTIARASLAFAGLLVTNATEISSPVMPVGKIASILTPSSASRLAALASDPGSKVGQAYGAYDAKNKVDNRSLFVIRPDGRVAYVTKPFKVLTPSAYTDLAAVVDSLAPAPRPDSAK